MDLLYIFEEAYLLTISKKKLYARTKGCNEESR